MNWLFPQLILKEWELTEVIYMNRVYQVKTVGLCFNNPSHKVEVGEYVILKADEHNEFDEDAVGVYNSDAELIGHVANSERTLSPNNRKNGNISATELKGNLDFTNREYYAEAVKVYNSCIYLEINEGKWSYINSKDEVSEPAFVKAIDLVEPEVEVTDEPTEIATLKAEVETLKAIVADLQQIVLDLKSIATGEANPSPKSSSDKVMYSFVGLSHFEGQNHLDGKLTIVEEPIFEGAKGTAVYLKSKEHRIGVSPSAKKKQYCEDHNIPYSENKSLKGKVIGGDIKIEKMVPDEYIVVSV